MNKWIVTVQFVKTEDMPVVYGPFDSEFQAMTWAKNKYDDKMGDVVRAFWIDKIGRPRLASGLVLSPIHSVQT